MHISCLREEKNGETVSAFLDLNGPEVVEVVVENDRLWINIDGRCMFRAQKVGTINFDTRQPVTLGGNRA